MGWLEKYLELVAETESPPAFHFWCAIAGLGHVLGRQVWLDQHRFRVYPGQMMVLLCSDSAVARKTTAMRCIGELIETLPWNRVNLIPQRVTGATLLDSLNRLDEESDPLDATGLIFAEELGNFFTREECRQDLPTLVTELNDAKEGPWKAPTRKYGPLVLQNPCLGMVGGVTKTGLAQEVPQQVRRTGYLGRVVLVEAEGAEHPHSLIEAPAGMVALRQWLLVDLHQRIAELRGKFKWSTKGAIFYDEWYNNHFYHTKALGYQESSGWLSRKHVHLLRTAIILTCAERSELVLHEDMLDRARLVLDRVESRMPEALREVGVDSPDQSRRAKLLERLEVLSGQNGNPWVPERTLFQRLYRFYARGGRELMKRDLQDYVYARLIDERQPGGRRCVEYRIRPKKGKMLKETP